VLFSGIVKIGLVEQARDQFFALTTVHDPFHAREVVERDFGRQVRIETELLWQIAQHSSEGVGIE